MEPLPPAKLCKNDATFVRQFERRILETIKKFHLLDEKKRIVVAVSGGKDSTAILYILKKAGYPLTALTVNTNIGCYTAKNLSNITDFCRQQGIKLKVIDFYTEFGYSVCYLRECLNEKGINVKSCTVCGVPRRYLINKYAHEMKADAVVTGHNLDDECQAVLMNLIRNTPQLSARLGPIVGSQTDPRFIPRIKPLYFVTNEDVARYSKIMNFPVEYGRCPCSTDAYRRHIKDWLNKLEEEDPGTKYNIIKRFFPILPKLKKIYSKSGGIGECRNCGEPTSGNLCKTCMIMADMKKPAGKPSKKPDTDKSEECGCSL